MKASDRPKDDLTIKKAVTPAGGFSATDSIFFNPLLSSGKLFYLFIGTLDLLSGKYPLLKKLSKNLLLVSLVYILSIFFSFLRASLT